MTKPTADSTAAAESWLRSQQNLQFLVNEALRDETVAEALTGANIPADEARAAILEDPAVLARLRAVRDWSKALRASRFAANRWGVRSYRLHRAPPVVRISTATLAVVFYVALFMTSVPEMPWWGTLVGLLGFFATLGYAVGLCADDVWSLFQLRAMRDGLDPGRWRSYVLDEFVLPALRQFVDERRAPDYDTTLSIRDVHNLYEDEGDAPVIITAGGQQLRRIIERSTSDAVAVAGHRGVGKTTTIQAAARGLFSDPVAPPPMRVLASAPSRYEARDFVLHLHAALAKQVIALTGRLLRWTPKPKGRLSPEVVAVLWLGVAAVVLAPIVHMAVGGTFAEFLADLRAAGAVAFGEFPRHVFEPAGSSGSVAVGLLYFALSLVITAAGAQAAASLPGAVRRLRRRNALPAVSDLHDLARQQLDRIRFLQTYTSGWSGKVGIPLGSGEMSWARGGERAEQQLTHPEVVEAFREFAGQAARVLVQERVIERIVIAVDELDKIAEPEKAHEFVNDIKGIFGIDGCLFLVAVSEDAISAFERRGIPVRDAFDSAFSEMVRMDAFTLAESRRWMARRLVGVPEPFSCLCHCLSGGLPRDLRRSTVDMLDAVRETGARDLASVAAVMIDRELDRKAHAFAAAARRHDAPEVTEHLADLLLIKQAGTPAELVALAHRLAPDPASAIASLRWQAACFVLFCATVREVFTNDLAESDLDSRIELLSTARAQLAVDPRVAWSVVCDVRASYGHPSGD